MTYVSYSSALPTDPSTPAEDSSPDIQADRLKIEKRVSLQSPNASLTGPHTHWVAAIEIVGGFGHREEAYNTIEALYLSHNKQRDRKIAERLQRLYQDALNDGEQVIGSSLAQFRDFFMGHPNLGVPKITMTPDGLLRARWIRGPEDFVAIEFTGRRLVKFVIELPRNGETATYFAVESTEAVVRVAKAIGASFQE